MNPRVLAIALVAATLPALPAGAAEPSIVISHPWLRATPKGAPVAGGYAIITNSGHEADTLVGASLPSAKEGQVHTMTMKNGVMSMRRLDKGLAIPPGATVTLRPGGDHLMFLGLGTPIKEGETVKGTITFAKAGTKPVVFAVGGMAARTAPGQENEAGKPGGSKDMQGMDMQGGGMRGTR